MNKALSFIRLEFITVKPYVTLKNLLIFTAVALIMIISSDASVSAIAMLMMYAALYVSYPFAVSEKNGLDALYATLSIRRGTVVLGRYLFALIVDLSAGLLAFVFSFAAQTVMQKSFNAVESLIATLVMLLLYSVIQAVQLPIYFKLGYSKAKFLAYLPFIGLAVIALTLTNFLKDSLSLPKIAGALAWLASNPLMAALACAVVWVGIMAVSCRASLAYYRRRDF